MLKWLNRKLRLAGIHGKETASRRKTYRYEVVIPGQAPVVLRAHNQQEVRKLVRAAHGVSRLPVGTTVERLD